MLLCTLFMMRSLSPVDMVIPSIIIPTDNKAVPESITSFPDIRYHVNVFCHVIGNVHCILAYYALKDCDCYTDM